MAKKGFLNRYRKQSGFQVPVTIKHAGKLGSMLCARFSDEDCFLDRSFRDLSCNAIVDMYNINRREEKDTAQLAKYVGKYV
jgi:hypothetical protein